jgi:hypothetical protein
VKLALPTIRPSGPGRVEQPWPKWPSPSAVVRARHPWSPHGGHTCGGMVVQPVPVFTVARAVVALPHDSSVEGPFSGW